MTELGLIIGSALVWLITEGVKKLKAIELSDKRRLWLRLVVAVLSCGAVVGSSMLTGSEVDTASIEAVASALVVFLGSQGVYLLGKQ